MSMTAAEVKRDLDRTYRMNVARAAQQVVKGTFDRTDEELRGLYPEVKMWGEFDYRIRRREVACQASGMGFGVDPADVDEIVKLLEGMEQ